MTDLLNPPPIRTGLQDANNDDTVKEWYYFWRASSDQINANRIKLDGLVTSGTHANRPDAGDMPEDALYVETDRGSIYQNQDGHWHYLAGTMWGTVTPDQRPTDLGVYDAGFDFRGTDDAREFIWSQTTWIEATEVRYGLHSARPAVATVADGVLYVESDRGAIYQAQVVGGTSVWKYLAGTMWGTLSPDQRPTGLGVYDAGFDFRGTDQQREFIWSGTAWIEAGQTGDAQIAYASTDITLTGTATAVPGASLNLNRAGRYLIVGVFWFESRNGGQFLIGNMSANGGANLALFQSPTGTSTTSATVTQQWMLTAGSPGINVFLTGYIAAGTGPALLRVGHTSISAIWISP